MQTTFPTPEPTSVYVEFGSGSLRVHATETDQTEVGVEGPDADSVTVEHRGDQIVVIAPSRRTGFFSGSGDLSVEVTLPLDSDLTVKVGSADVEARGRYGGVRVKSGSGDVALEELSGPSTVDTGSGDIEIATAHDDLRVKAGSGEVAIGRVQSSTVISTGSGGIELGSVHDDTVLKSGSGDVRVKEAHTDLSAMTGSGDLYVACLHRGAFRGKAASGDINVGVPAGVPVWTDLSCLTGSVRSNLQGAGQPSEGQDYIEIRATTVSGDINLAQL